MRDVREEYFGIPFINLGKGNHVQVIDEHLDRIDDLVENLRVAIKDPQMSPYELNTIRRDTELAASILNEIEEALYD